MPIIIRPWGNTDLDLTGATIVAETALPQTLSGLDAGSYEIGRISWNATEQVVTDAAVFSPRSTRFNGTTSDLNSSSLSVPGSSQGTFAGWVYFDGTWNSVSGATVFEVRVGATIALRIYSANSGRISVNLSGASIFTSTPTGVFAGGRWHHIAVSWKAGAGGWYQVSIDGAAPLNGADLTSATLAIDDTVTRCFVGSVSGASRWIGDLGHLYCNLTTALDLTVQANREKFILAGDPVDLGANGSIPTGAQPAFYFDGGAAMQNLGSGGTLTATDLTLGAVPAIP